jgi:hypothetical protein
MIDPMAQRVSTIGPDNLFIAVKGCANRSIPDGMNDDLEPRRIEIGDVLGEFFGRNDRL